MLFLKIDVYKRQDANKNYSVRVYRIKNKLTKTQMIVFASENATLNIRINNTVVFCYKYIHTQQKASICDKLMLLAHFKFFA